MPPLDDYMENFGPYRILQQAGTGAYSEILLAEKDQRLSAIKRNKRQYRYDREIFQILDQEAEILRRLKGSPYFPDIFDSGVFEDCHFIEMEFIDGLNLSQLMEKKQNGLPTAISTFIAHELCQGLELLHSLKNLDGKPMVHGDLKLKNVMVDISGRVKILDLGLSGVTFRYMPLERLHDKMVAPYSDLFALGLILYELTHGKHLFETASKYETYVQMRETRVDCDLFRSDLPTPLKYFLRRCLKQDGEDRYQSATEMKADLEACLREISDSPSSPILGELVKKLKRPIVPILPVGRFLSLDDAGYLVNESSADKIRPPWTEAIEDIRRNYIDRLGPALHSIYLRGSTSRGTAIPGISDVDTFAVCQGPRDRIPTSWAPRYYHRFIKQFPFANGLDLQFIHIDDLFRGMSHFSYRFIIKVLATCIEGPNLADRIHKFKPTLKIAFFYHGNLREVLIESLEKIETAENEEQVRLWSNYALRRILRLGFAINIESERVYTRDLYPCYQVFSKYYPQYEPKMRKALFLALNLPSKQDEIIPLLRDLGGWLVLESERIFARRPAE